MTRRFAYVPAPVRLAGRWLVRLMPIAGIVGLLASARDLRSFNWWPALIGIIAWTLGNYGASVLRWRSVSGRGLGLGWYARVFAEGELLGLLTPQHAGALYWRARQLRKAGADGAGAAAELTADRLCTSATVTLALLIGGSALPLAARLVVWSSVALLVTGLVLSRRRWLHRLPTLGRGKAAVWLGYSVAFQLLYIGFVVAVIASVGVSVSIMGVIGLLAVAQVASILPGVHGAGPKEGVLAGGLMAMGAPHGAALGVVGLLVALVWVPAILLGGTGMAARGFTSMRARLAS